DVQPLCDDTGVAIGFVGVAADITERRQAQADLRIAAIAFDSLEAIAITDARQNVLRVNPAFTRITGYTAAEARGQVMGRLLRSGRHEPGFYEALWQRLRAERHWQGEIWNRRKNGQVYPEWLSITAVPDEAGAVVNYVAVFADITQKKQADETIHQLAFYDALTELPNRRLMRDRLGQVQAARARHGRPAAVLFIDLDHFKALNDMRGHSMGDRLLVEVARRLQLSVRANDTVARQGGDEFVVILPELSAGPEQAAVDAENVAEKVRAALARPFFLAEHEWVGSASIGISMLGGDDASLDEVLKRADIAMYEAKRSGRNAVRFFDPAAHAAMLARSALEADLRHALPGGQLLLHYQVQVDELGYPVGAEVLLRWLHPHRGMVAPGSFIALAEDTDLILPIGHWVLQMACSQLRRWAETPATRHLQLAVNVSARQFRQPDFVEQIRMALAVSGAKPNRLKLELTESLVLVNLDDTLAKMQAIKALGVSFAIDDFGTGQSSLTYLTRLALDQLKIDQSFVAKMLNAHTDAVIVQTIIGMANNLGLEVIAEGVETEQQLAFLRHNGCRRFQGYLLGRPVSIEQFELQLAALPQADGLTAESGAGRRSA
ncbi:putative bifunctional diguanylate cyclase/phosphodiesterase, partial [Roseateles sp.]|uniref:putative bifunctional diguanylate cyclase/phosphodiesterase n=1 Tax=Roseateles sp. TaxID=1971397 RepID=UPI00286B2910